MKYKIPLFKTYWNDDDIEAVNNVIRRGNHWAVGPELEEFEQKIMEYVGTKYALSFNSGTSALHLALLACNIKDKEVIVPSFTFAATVNAVVLAGGIPVFAESEGNTFGLDADDVQKKITGKTKAIVNLHYAGFASKETLKLRKIANNHNLILVDDAAESFGAMIDGKKVGCFADVSILSFCQNKIISTGEGGAIVTDSEEIYEKVKLLRSHGRSEATGNYFTSTKDNDYIDVGYNLRMSSMTAALGISQLSKIDQIISMRREKAHFLDEGLSKINEIEVLTEPEGFFSVYQMYTIKLPDELTRNALQEHLTKNGIMTKIYFNPIHLKTAYQRMYSTRVGNLVKTEELSKRVLTLPMYPGLSEEELNYLISTIKSFFINGEQYGTNI